MKNIEQTNKKQKQGTQLIIFLCIHPILRLLATQDLVRHLVRTLCAQEARLGQGNLKQTERQTGRQAGRQTDRQTAAAAAAAATVASADLCIHPILRLLATQDLVRHLVRTLCAQEARLGQGNLKQTERQTGRQAGRQTDRQTAAAAAAAATVASADLVAPCARPCPRHKVFGNLVRDLPPAQGVGTLCATPGPAQGRAQGRS